MLSGTQKEQAEKRLKLIAEEEEQQKIMKNKIKSTSKIINEKLKEFSQDKDFNKILNAINAQQLMNQISILERKSQTLSEYQQNLKNEKQKTNRDKMNLFQEKQRLNAAIQEIKETIKKIQKAIEESLKEEEGRRRKIEEDLQKSLVQIKEKIEAFEKQSEEIEKDSVELRVKKEEVTKKLQGLETDFKEKAEEKDQVVKKQKEELMGNLKVVEEEVNEATQLNKTFGALEKQNFDNKLSIYLRTKKFPQLSNSFENSATTIDKCKQQLFKGAHRLQAATQTIAKNDEKSKELSEVFLQKLKIQNQKQEKIQKVKNEKEEIRARILQLQMKKKEKQSEQN